jgi:iron complex outermembrane recepter protein
VSQSFTFRSFPQATDTAGCRSNYSNFGGTTNSQLGLRWRPVDDLLVRANYAQGFRAPSVDELFGGAVERRNVFPDDPCDAFNEPSPAVQARCLSLGVPANVDENLETGAATIAGNPQLAPETSRSHGVGFVYDPAWLPGFAASVDQVGRNGLRRRCLQLPRRDRERGQQHHHG